MKQVNMLHVEVHTDKIVERLNAMTASIDVFGKTDMPQGLTDWQVQDMKRKYPETDLEENIGDEVSATTTIYPRSRTYDQTHPYQHRPAHLMHHVVATAVRKPVLSSMPRLKHSIIRHPILRPELFDMLFSRMTAILSEKIKWR
jgi:hypothetical protein